MPPVEPPNFDVLPAPHFRMSAHQSLHPRILHFDAFRFVKVLSQTNSALVILGRLFDLTSLNMSDHQFIGPDMKVIIKQFNLNKDREGWKKELKILNRIKKMKLPNNGGFPVIFTSKVSDHIGEIMMSYIGQNIYDEFKLEKSFQDSILHQKVDQHKVLKIGTQLIT